MKTIYLIFLIILIIITLGLLVYYFTYESSDTIETNLALVTFVNNGNYVWSDNMKNAIINSLDRWSRKITSLPDEKILLRLEIDTQTPRAYAGTKDIFYATANNIAHTVRGTIVFGSTYYDIWLDGGQLFTDVFNHEFGHVLGIGTLWDVNNLLTLEGSRYLYIGTNALNIYQYYNENGETLKINDVDTNYKNNAYSGVSQCVGIPIEDNGGAGTAGAHPEEGRGSYTNGDESTNDIYINDVYYPGLGDEIMTGLAESEGTTMPISAITLGFLKDLNYGVNYAQADAYTLGTGANTL